MLSYWNGIERRGVLKMECFHLDAPFKPDGARRDALAKNVHDAAHIEQQ